MAFGISSVAPLLALVQLPELWFCTAGSNHGAALQAAQPIYKSLVPGYWTYSNYDRYHNYYHDYNQSYPGYDSL
jgi:hypothetical protein